jgi:hypothetical protein
MPPDWDGGDPPPAVPYAEFAYFNLPEEPGVWCRYEVNLLVPQLSSKAFKLNRVEVRVLEQEIVDTTPYRWIEVEVQTGEDYEDTKIVEAVKLLVNEELYRNERKFEFLQDKSRLRYQAATRLQVGDQEPLYARFDPKEDRISQFHKDKVPLKRIPIRNVLSLLFGADFTPNFLPFNIRKHISYALTDGKLMRYYLPDKMVAYTPDVKDDLKCTLIRPGRSVSIVKSGALPPTTLGYDIFISQDPKAFPFRWVKLDLNLYEEDDDHPGAQVFGGRLKLRSFGRDAVAKFDQPVEWVVKAGDPGESEAFEMAYRTYFKEAKKAPKAKAIDYYERFIKLCPDTLAAYEAQAEIDKLNGK